MRRWPLHPVLFATFPVLFLFAQNVDRVRPGKIALPLAMIVAGAVVITTIAALVLRDLRKGAIVGSAAVLLGLSYGHAWGALEGKSVASLVVGRDLVLLPLWIALGLGALAFAWRLRAKAEVTLILNAVAGGLVLMSLVSSSTAVAQQSGQPMHAKPGKRSATVGDVKDGTTRDIYYLIFDRYGGPYALDRYYDFDNSEFLGDLRERAFFVADRSVANYPRTAHSLGSSLNMRYLDDLAKSPGEDSSDWKPLYAKFVGPRVSRFLQERGYRYAHIGAWWDPSASDPTAQFNYHFDKRSEFSRVLLETSIVRPLAKRIGLLADLDGRQAIHKQVLSQFDHIVDASKLDGPTFVFSHILMPHEPYTFDADGSYVTEEEEKSRPLRVNYTNQVRFANLRIRALIDRLLDVPEDEKPIIVLQADEGPHPQGRIFGMNFSWKRAGDDELREKFSILNAYHFPGIEDPGLYPTVTPVNSFRLLFDRYFGTSLGTLPDESFVFGTQKEPYDFARIDPVLEPIRRTKEHE